MHTLFTQSNETDLCHSAQKCAHSNQISLHQIVHTTRFQLHCIAFRSEFDINCDGENTIY